MIIGYTSGVFDLFHIGHLNILKKAASQCDKLIVGVTSDEFAMKYKNKKPVVPFKERFEIIKSIKYVDEVFIQNNHDKFKQWEILKFNVMFVGNDWKNTKKWNGFEEEFSKVNVKIIYFERTPTTSSTQLRKKINNDNQ
jgi:glycerol-3-phosphate cytidylyltransferase